MKNVLDYFDDHGLTPRTPQIIALNTIEKEWDNYDYFILDLSTGCGKTHVALAVANAIKNSYVLTSTIQLQEQYQKMSSSIVNLKGRSNYTCAVNNSFNVDEAPCNIERGLLAECKSMNRCPYYNKKQEAISAKTMITNYMFFMYSTHCGFATHYEPQFIQRDAVIMDEAHNLESHLISFAETKINIEELVKKHSLSGLKNHKFSLINEINEEIIDDIIKIISAKSADLTSKITQKLQGRAKVSLTDWAKSFDGVIASDISSLQSKLYSLDKILQPLKIYQENRDGGRWIMHADENENSLILTPLKADFLFRYYMKKMGKKFIFMSATIGDPQVFMTEIGLDPLRTKFVTAETTFKPEISPIVILPYHKMGYKDINASLPKIAESIKMLLAQHPNESGIIHCGTYKISDELVNLLPYDVRKRLIYRTMKNVHMNNEMLLKIHESRTIPNSVLLSPSLIEGTDLYDDLSRFQIILKMPWGSLGDVRTKNKADNEPSWYANNMWNKILQASGRSTRHEKDYSVTYVLDASYPYFEKQWKKKLPKWYIDRVVKD